MTWKKYNFPYIPSLEDYNQYSAKRFTKIRLDKLISHRQGWIESHLDKLSIKDMRSAIEFGIININYPLVKGRPDDTHNWNAFRGKSCYTLSWDYWQTAEETLMTYLLNQKLKFGKGWGDCEDSSIFIVSLLRILKIPAYEILGKVYENNKLLGGHGYLIAQFPDGLWRLIESTLDTPPEWYTGYPVVKPEMNVYRFGSWTYKSMIKFNELEYYIFIEDDKKMNKESDKAFDEYVKMSFKDKETLEKHEALKKLWGSNKVLNRRGLVSKLRWRHKR